MLDPAAKKICPLCGEPNQCAMAADPDASECWCENEKFPAELIGHLPAGMIGQKCICKSCLDRLKAEHRSD